MLLTRLKEVPTSDFDFFDGFVALVFDLDFDWDRLPVEIQLWTKPGGKHLNETNGKGRRTVNISVGLQPYIFVHGGFKMNRLVRHHEALADFSLGPIAHLFGSILDLTNDKASGVSARNKDEEEKLVKQLNEPVS